jgi:hypothetical protein
VAPRLWHWSWAAIRGALQQRCMSLKLARHPFFCARTYLETTATTSWDCCIYSYPPRWSPSRSHVLIRRCRLEGKESVVRNRRRSATLSMNSAQLGPHQDHALRSAPVLKIRSMQGRTTERTKNHFTCILDLSLLHTCKDQHEVQQR